MASTAVHREDLVVGVGTEEGIARHGELGAHQEAENTGEQKEKEGCTDIEVADNRVVDGRDDAPALRRRPDPLQRFPVLVALRVIAGRGH
jgi:hypothetical protein